MCCQGKAGQGHRIESIAWNAQTIVYCTIFPNKINEMITGKHLVHLVSVCLFGGSNTGT